MKKNCTIQDIRDRALRSFIELDFSNKTSKKFNNEGEMIFDYSNSQKYKTEVAAIKVAENIKKKIEPDIGTWASDNGFSDFKKGWLNLRFRKNKVVLKFKFNSRLDAYYTAKIEKENNISKDDDNTIFQKKVDFNDLKGSKKDISDFYFDYFNKPQQLSLFDQLEQDKQSWEEIKDKWIESGRTEVDFNSMNNEEREHIIKNCL